MNDLFLYLHKKFNILLLESEMEEVLKICEKIIEERKESERRCAEQELKDKKLKNNNLKLLKEMRCLTSCNDSECDTNGCKQVGL